MKHYRKLFFIGLITLLWLYAVPAMAVPLDPSHSLPPTATYNETTGELTDTATYIYAETYKGWAELVKVSLPNATFIGNSVFSDCINLESIDLPKVASTGTSVFYRCAKLEEVELPNLTAIANDTFMDCSSLTTLNAPVLMQVGENAFSNCISLNILNAPALKSISRDAFSLCKSLTTIDLPSLTSIGHYNAFFACSSLTTLNTPALTFIGTDAFKGCSNLTTVNAPNVTTVYMGAFSGCSSLQSLSLPMATSFAGSAISRCSALTTLRLDSVTSFGGVDSITPLKKLAIPNAQSISQNALQYYPNLEVLIIGDELIKSMGDYYIPNNAGLTVYVPTALATVTAGKIAPSGALHTHIETYDMPALKDVFIGVDGIPKSCVASSGSGVSFASNNAEIKVDSSGNCSATREASAIVTGKKIVTVDVFNDLALTATCSVHGFSTYATAESLTDGSTATMTSNRMIVYASNDLYASTNYISKSDVPSFTFVSHDDNWFKITYNSNTAYIPKPFIRIITPTTSPSASPTPGSAYGFVAAGTNVYADPNGGQLIGTVNSAGMVLVLGQTGNYYYIRLGDAEGYVLKSSVTGVNEASIPELTPTPSITPRPSYTPRPTYLPQPGGNSGSSSGGNSDVTITPPADSTPVENGVKMKVKINGVETEVTLGLDNFTYDYTTPETVTAITGFKLRKGPDAAFGTYRSVRKGEKLTIIGRERDWLKVDMGNGKVAYILEDMTTK